MLKGAYDFDAFQTTETNKYSPLSPISCFGHLFLFSGEWKERKDGVQRQKE